MLFDLLGTVTGASCYTSNQLPVVVILLVRVSNIIRVHPGCSELVQQRMQNDTRFIH
jgi:hypothetical protein